MIWRRLVRSEIRKLTSTRMPLAFLLVLIGIAALNAVAVMFGTEADGSKAFVATGFDQQSLVAFASNAFIIAGLLGAIAAAQEYQHRTVIPTFLASPRRYRAAISQFGAIFIAGGALGLAGAGLVIVAVVVALPSTEYGFLMGTGAIVRVLSASTFAGATGSVLGAGIGVLVRNTGGAVVGTVITLIVAPPLVVQLTSEAASWIPASLANAVSGVGGDTTVPAALAALAAWALVPAAAGLLSVQRRDVV